jgi:hypothetical protein
MFVQDVFLYLIVTRHKLTVRYTIQMVALTALQYLVVFQSDEGGRDAIDAKHSSSGPILLVP